LARFSGKVAQFDQLRHFAWRDSLNAKVRRLFGEYERKRLGVGYGQANLQEALAIVIHGY
jgi:hypothetical protein